MFTGIIEEVGTVEKIERKTNLSALKLRAKKILAGVKKGDSIAIDGVCLTVTGKKRNVLFFDIMRETLLRTSLGYLRPKSKVNLERALKVGARIDGHFVSGHVDDIGIIKKKITRKNYTELHISLNKYIRQYIVSKGSICIDGVSLTVGVVKKNYFSVYLIPFTEEITTLGIKKNNDRVNIETDILAKYILNR